MTLTTSLTVLLKLTYWLNETCISKYLLILQVFVELKPASTIQILFKTLMLQRFVSQEKQAAEKKLLFSCSCFNRWREKNDPQTVWASFLNSHLNRSRSKWSERKEDKERIDYNRELFFLGFGTFFIQTWRNFLLLLLLLLMTFKTFIRFFI